MNKANLVFKILIIQLLFCLLTVVIISGMRLYSKNQFNEFEKFYEEYARYDTNTSLVYEGN